MASPAKVSGNLGISGTANTPPDTRKDVQPVSGTGDTAKQVGSWQAKEISGQSRVTAFNELAWSVKSLALRKLSFLEF